MPLDEYKANLKTIIAHLRTLHAAQRIILITPPPVDDVRRGVCVLCPCVPVAYVCAPPTHPPTRPSNKST